MVLSPDSQIHFVNIDEVLEIHRNQVEATGSDTKVRNEGVLRACLSTPSNRMGGAYAHQDLFEMAAAYLFHLTDQKPFYACNQRVALITALYFLYLHGIEVTAQAEGLADLVRRVSGGKATKMIIADFLRKHSVKKE